MLLRKGLMSAYCFYTLGCKKVIYLVYRFHDPVDSRIPSDSLVLRVDKNDLKIFVGRVLVDPVRVQNPKVGATSANSLFCGCFERALIFQLVDTLVRWFTYISYKY